MKRLVRRGLLLFTGLLTLSVVGAAIVYGISERILHRTYDVQTAQLTVPTDADAIQEGHRLATIHGCENSCHGTGVQGKLMFDDPMIARIVAPNLTAAVEHYNDVQIAALIRHGIRPDGRSLMIMPADAFATLTDEDLGRIIAYLRSVPKVEGPGPSVSIGPIGRIGLVMGKFETAAQLLNVGIRAPEADGDQDKYGRYLALTICGACHGVALTGDSNPHYTAPGLQIVAAYSLQDFTRLLRKGTAMGDRELGVMSESARNNLSQLTDAEIGALYSYLHHLTVPGHST